MALNTPPPLTALEPILATFPAVFKAEVVALVGFPFRYQVRVFEPQVRAT